MKKSIEYDDNLHCDVIVEDDDFQAYTEPDSYTLDKKTSEYMGELNGETICGSMLQSSKAGFKFYYFTVE